MLMRWLSVNRLVAVLLLSGTAMLGQGNWIKAKGWLAQQLIAASWDQRERGALPGKPWPWADTRTVAKLTVPGLDITQYVMADASGESLAFGPGSVLTGSPPGGAGASVIAGHRDTHFRFLADVSPGERVELENYMGERRAYTVSRRQVVDSRAGGLQIDVDAAALTLVTCWPMDAVVPGGPLRYLVQAEVFAGSGSLAQDFGEHVALLRDRS